MAKYSSGFTMKHRMGLVGLTMGTNSSAVTTITYDGNTSTELYRSTGTTSTTSLALFDNFSPLNSSSTYYYIVKHLTAYTLNSGYKVTTTSGSPVYQWSQTITNNQIDKGTYKSYSPTPSFRNFARLYGYIHDTNNTDEAKRPGQNFQHYGAVQEFALPFGCTLKLEVWGSGGSAANEINKGRGGYSVGNYNIAASNTLYLCIGGKGIATGVGYELGTNNGGYNGGGSGQTGGGGATHIAITNHGELVNYESRKGDVLIVAGGGGGFDAGSNQINTNRCGEGGGIKGTKGWETWDANNYGGPGGTQTAGGVAYGTQTWGIYTIKTDGSFGRGGDAKIWSTYPTFSTDRGAGGGGGWYGGASSNGGTNFCGGGGSGYLNTGKLISGTSQTIIAGDSSGREGSAAVDVADIPNPTSDDGTLIVGNTSSGYARITIMPYN